MKEFLISNASFYDKDYATTFCKWQEYKHWVVSVKGSTIFDEFEEQFKEALGSKAETVAKDVALTEDETKALQAVYSKALDEKLKDWKEIDVPPNEKITFKERDYEIRLSLTRPKDRHIWDFYTIYNLCQESLDAKKPLYLSVE